LVVRVYLLVNYGGKRLPDAIDSGIFTVVVVAAPKRRGDLRSAYGVMRIGEMGQMGEMECWSDGFGEVGTCVWGDWGIAVSGY